MKNHTQGKHFENVLTRLVNSPTLIGKSICLAFLSLFLFTAKNDAGVMHLYAGWEPVPATCLLVGLFMLFRLLLWCMPDHQSRLVKVLLGLVSAVFSTFTVAGICYDASDVSQSLVSILRANMYNKLSLIVLLAAALCLFYVLIRSLPGLFALMQEQWDGLEVARRLEKLFFGRCATLCQAALLLVCWVPQLLLRYPGVVTQDALYSLAQYQGISPYTTKHPLIYTCTFGWFVELGRMTGHPNFGLFLFTAVQTIAVACVVVYTSRVLHALGAPCWLQLLFVAVSAVSPVVFPLASTAVKDTPFLIGFMLLLDEVALFLFCKKDASLRPAHLLAVMVGTFLLFFRNNGMYTALLLCALLMCREVVVSIRSRVIHAREVVFVLALLVATFGGRAVNSYMISALNAKQVTSRVLYSSVIQQIGRTLSLYPEDVSKEEMTAIQKVMDVSKEEYAHKYNPLNFDSVKGYFNQEATDDDRRAFLVIWLELGRRHPDVYLASIMHQNYLMFSPLRTDVKFYKRVSEVWKRSTREYTYDFSGFFSEKKALVSLQEGLRKLYISISKFPVIGLFSSVGLANLVFFGLIAYALAYRRLDWLILALPCFLTIGITFFGPAFSGNARYLYPLLWSMPLLMGSLYATKPQGKDYAV